MSVAIKTLMATLSRDAHDAAYFDDMEEHFDPGQPRVHPTHIGYLILVTWWHIRFSLLGLACRFLGHDVTSDGWAGTESGGENLCCRRCGWSHRIKYY